MNVRRTPERALAEHVLLTPMLVRRATQLERRVPGNPGDARVLAAALGVETAE